MHTRAILIAGPTASGKTALAIKIAKHFGGAVVNADSMQVYRDLSVLTARPTTEEQQHIPHMLFGHVDASENYSVGRWLEDLSCVLNEIRGRGLFPVIVGGTGLYFKSALHGISNIPAVPDDIRSQLRDRAKSKTAHELHTELSALDPETANRLRPTDPQRVLRALEVYLATGQSLASFQASRSRPILSALDCLAFFLAPERVKLREDIDLRFDDMMTRGALQEVTALKQRGLDPRLPCMRAHGVPYLNAHLNDEMSLAEAVQLGKRDTRLYTKRQFTFARHQLPEFRWIDPNEGFAMICQLL